MERISNLTHDAGASNATIYNDCSSRNIASADRRIAGMVADMAVPARGQAAARAGKRKLGPAQAVEHMPAQRMALRQYRMVEVVRR